MVREMLDQANKAPLMAEPARHTALAAMKFAAAGFTLGIFLTAPLLRIIGG